MKINDTIKKYNEIKEKIFQVLYENSNKYLDFIISIDVIESDNDKKNDFFKIKAQMSCYKTAYYYIEIHYDYFTISSTNYIDIKRKYTIIDDTSMSKLRDYLFNVD